MGRVPFRCPASALAPLRRLLKNSFAPRLLKKVQIQDGARSEARGVLSAYVAASHPSSRWVPGAPTPEMGLFQEPVRLHLYGAPPLRTQLIELSLEVPQPPLEDVALLVQPLDILRSA